MIRNPFMFCNSHHRFYHSKGMAEFLCQRIERSGVYSCTVVRLSVHLSMYLSVRTNESVLKWLGLGWVRVSFPLVYIIVT